MYKIRETVSAIYGDVRGGHSDSANLREEMRLMRETLETVRSGVNYLKLDKKQRETFGAIRELDAEHEDIIGDDLDSLTGEATGKAKNSRKLNVRKSWGRANSEFV